MGGHFNNLRYRYANDIVLFATSAAAALHQIVDKVDAVSRDYGLEVSARRTKVKVVVK